MSFRPFPQHSNFRSQEFPGGPIDTSPEGYLVVAVAGDARGNPGPAGYGVVVEDEIGRPVAQFSEFVGRQTTLYAAYAGLLEAINYTLSHQFRSMKVITDSAKLAQQICGAGKPAGAAQREIHSKVMLMLDRFNYFDIKHESVEEGKEANRLANVAIDRGKAKKAPAVNPPQPAGASLAVSEVNGVVHNGVVELIAGTLPEGLKVKVRPA